MHVISERVVEFQVAKFCDQCEIEAVEWTSELSVTFPIHPHSIPNIPRLDLNVIRINSGSHPPRYRSLISPQWASRADINRKKCRWDNAWGFAIDNAIALMYVRSNLDVRINFLAAQYNSVFSQEIHWPSKHRVVDVYTQFQRVLTSEIFRVWESCYLF